MKIVFRLVSLLGVDWGPNRRQNCCRRVAHGHMDARGKPALQYFRAIRQPTQLELVSKVWSDPFTWTWDASASQDSGLYWQKRSDKVTGPTLRASEEFPVWTRARRGEGE
jgi:hypothetical protein